MDLFWRILLVLVACAEAESLTVVPVELGQNATLNCSLSGNSIYWYVEISSQVRGRIAEAHSPDPKDTFDYIYRTLTRKYIATTEKLLITNITAEDYRLYFCGKKKNSTITLEDTFRLVSVAPSNDTKANCPKQLLNTTCQSELIIYSLLALTTLLLFVIIILVTALFFKRKKCTHEVTEPTPSTAETLEMPQYEEIQLGGTQPAAPVPECVYYKIELPKSKLLQH